jgi:hypothetical protein
MEESTAKVKATTPTGSEQGCSGLSRTGYADGRGWEAGPVDVEATRAKDDYRVGAGWSMTMAIVRKKIKWATKRRHGGTRQWKTKWITMHVKDGATSKADKPAKG